MYFPARSPGPECRPHGRGPSTRVLYSGDNERVDVASEAFGSDEFRVQQRAEVAGRRFEQFPVDVALNE